MSGESDSSYEEDRKLTFERYYAKRSDPKSLFNLPGMEFRRFNSERIAFRFRPRKLVEHVLPTLSFLCVIIFDGKHWRIRRDTFPVNYKWRIYELFWNRNFFAVTDERIISTISNIYNKLHEWAYFDSIWREDKFKRYLDGDSDVTLNSDDEQLFLNEDQRTERAIRKAAIYKRMIPPEPQQRYSKLRRRRFN